MNPITKLIQAYRKRKARKSVLRYVSAASAKWAQLAQTKAIEVDTIEGLRSLISSGFANGKLIKVSGELVVKTPLVVSSRGTLYDFSECILVSQTLPVLFITGFMNCFNDMNIELPQDNQAEPVETLEEDQEPSGKHVVSGFVDSGSAFLDLSLFTTCPVEEMDSVEPMLD
jgi:hypothetical protein